METRYKTIPFDVNRINEEGVQVVTRNGKSVRILCVDAKNFNKPIIGLVKRKYDNVEDLYEYEINGKSNTSLDESVEDLFLQVPIIATKYRRMTNQELAWWLRDCPEEHREWKYEDRSPHLVKSVYEYQDNMNADDKVKDNILVRRNGGEWEEPLIEN